MSKGKSSSQGSFSLPKAPTGICGLDEVTGGGLPLGRTTLVCGGAGSGKTLLAMEFLAHGAIDCGEPGVFMSFEEKERGLITNFASIGIDLKQLCEDRKMDMEYVEVDKSEIEETGEYDLEALFVRLGLAIDTIGAKRVALDTLESLFAGLTDAGVLRAELRRLFGWLNDRGVTTIVTGERGQGTLTRFGLEEYISDCVILLDNRVSNEMATRRLRILKYRGSSHGSNEYPFIVDRFGMSILPISSLRLEHEAPSERVSTGIHGLDDMLSGEGYYRDSSILFTGAAGTGKTSLACAFIEAGCRRGERCIYFASEESPRQITRNMRSIGIDLEPWTKKGLLRFEAARVSSESLEAHLLGVQRLVTELQPSLVVVDALSDLLDMGSPLEVKWMSARLVDFLKSQHVTSVFTSLVTGEANEGMSGVGISSTMDCWLHMENVKNNLERNRSLNVLKSRGMKHSNQAREFLITDKGLDLVNIYVSSAGGLMGSARLAQEAADRASQSQRRHEIEDKRQALKGRRESMEAKIAAMRAEFRAEALEVKRAMKEAEQREADLVKDSEAMAQKRGGGSKSQGRAAARRAKEER